MRAFCFAMIVGLSISGTHASDVPPERLAKLARGVNLSHWFWLPAGGDAAFADAAFFTADDAKMLREAGITHVRLPIDPGRLFDDEAGTLNDRTIERLEKSLDLLNAAGLAVVVEPHPGGTRTDETYNARLHDGADKDAARLVETFAKNWGALAKRLSTRDANLVFFEVMNEPVFDKRAERWLEIQAVVAKAIREAAPKHTIIATGNSYSSVDALKKVKPLDDANVIYTFHFYDPHTFTHQTATWGAPNWKFLKDIPYPSSPELVKDAMSKIENERAKGEAKWYGDERWNKAKIEGKVKEAAAWAKEHDTVVWCGEFGAYRQAPAESRERWIADVRSVLESNQIGWCMWDWAGGFSLVKGEKGARTIDADTAKALGLKIAP